MSFEYGIKPTVIDVTLYKYNYIDNKLYTRMKSTLDYINDMDDSSSILVSFDQLNAFMLSNYTKEYNKIKSTSRSVLHKSSTSVYFLFKILEEYSELNFIKIKLNTDKSYTRIEEIDEKPMLVFNHTILAATLNLYDVYESNELQIINEILRDLGILYNNIPYMKVVALDFANALDDYIADRIEHDLGGNSGTLSLKSELSVDLLELLYPKVQDDNTLIMVVTDFN